MTAVTAQGLARTVLRSYEGLRVQPLESQRFATLPPCSPSSSCSPASSRGFTVVAVAKAPRKRQIVLTKDVPNLGKTGDLAMVKPGYFRNYLYPYGFAKVATQDILDAIQAEKDREVAEKKRAKQEAQTLAQTLQMVGQYTIRKKPGEGKTIFGSVTSQDVVDAIKLQTLKDVDKKDVSIPEIRELGLHDCQIRLHPEVVAKVKLNILPGK